MISKTMIWNQLCNAWFCEIVKTLNTLRHINMHVNATTWRLILYVQYNSLVCKMLKFPHLFHINKMQPQNADVKALINM